jgi:hypothetical protein
MDEQAIANAYARIHVAMRGLYSNLISAKEYLHLIREIRIELEQKQCSEKKTA